MFLHLEKLFQFGISTLLTIYIIS